MSMVDGPLREGGVISDCVSETMWYMFPGFFIINYYKYTAGVINNYRKEYTGHDPDDLDEVSRYWFITAVDVSCYFVYCVAREGTISLSGKNFFSYIGGSILGGSLYTAISIPTEELSRDAVFYGIASSASYTFSFKYLPLSLAVVPATVVIELGTAALFLEGGYKDGVLAAASFSFVGLMYHLADFCASFFNSEAVMSECLENHYENNMTSELYSCRIDVQTYYSTFDDVGSYEMPWLTVQYA